MANVESQEEDDRFKPMSLVSQMRTPHRDEVWSASLCQTFFTTSVGSQIPVITEMPLSTCGYKKFQLDVLVDYLYTCTTHSGAKKDLDWLTDPIADLFLDNPQG